MLKVKTVYDYRQELCAELRSGKWQMLKGALGQAPGNSHCAVGLACRLGMIDSHHDKADITGKGIAVLNNLPETTFEDVAKFIESLP